MSRRCSGLLLAVGLLSLSPVGRAAEVPESLLPPVVRPVARISLQVTVQNPYQRRYGGGGSGMISSAVFSADAKYLAAMDGQTACLQLYDAKTGKLVRQLANQMQQVSCMAFSPNGKTLLTTHNDNTGGVYLTDVATGKELKQLDEGANETNFMTAAWSPDGTKLALAGMNPHRGNQIVFTLWDAANGDEIRQLTTPPPGIPMIPGQQQIGMIESMAFAPDGKSLALIVGKHIHLVEVATGKLRGQVATLPGNKMPAADDQQQQMMMMMMMQRGRGGMMQQPASCLAFSPDGRVLAVGCHDETIRLFEILTGKELPPLTGHRNAIQALSFSPDGKSLKSVGMDSQMLVWRINGPFRSWQPRGEKLSAEELAGLWEGLNAEDPWMTYAILANLAAVPGQSVPFIRAHLRPASATDAERIRKLVAELQGEDYNKRKKALVQLRKLGDAALPALRDAQPMGSSQVLNMLLMKLEAERQVGGLEQELLAVEALERIGTKEARDVLGVLAKGAPAAAITLRAKASLDAMTKLADPKKEIKVDALWADLGKNDAMKAYAAIKALALRPKEAVPMLRQRLRGLSVLKAIDDDPRRIEKLITELDNDDFAVRENSTEELKKLGGRAEKQLRQRLKSGSTPESAKRIEELLKEIAQPEPTSEAFLLERGLETLERIGSTEARESLQLLAREATLRPALEQIKASLQRVEALVGPSPN